MCAQLPGQAYLPPNFPGPFSNLATYSRLLVDEEALDQEVQTRDGIAELTEAIRQVHSLISADQSIREGRLGCLFAELLKTRLYLWQTIQDSSSPAPHVSIDLFRIDDTLLDDLRKAAEGLFAKSPEGGPAGDCAEEWLPASEAVERAEGAGFPITLSWLSRPPRKSGVRTRPRVMEGNHQLEVEWNSLAGYLMREKAAKGSAEKRGAAEAGTGDLQRRIAAASSQKRRSRPLD
jgi:hypothetical protein